MYQVNGSGRSILEFAKKGLKVSEIIKKTDIKQEDVINYLRELSKQGLVTLSKVRTNRAIDTSLPDKIFPRLEFLWVEVTSRCNLHCLHCYADAGPKKDIDLPAGLIKKVLDEASRMGCKNIQFTGGECTLRADLADLIGHAKRRGFESIEIFTNGTVLSEPFIRFLKRSNVNVALSLYSHDPSVHDKITGVKGSFSRLHDNLQKLLENKVTTRGSLISMKQNEEDMDETISYFERMGIVDRRPDPVRPGGRGKNIENWPQGLMARTAPSFKIEKADFNRNVSGNSCWSGEAAVAANGDVLPCVFARNLIAGNVKEQPLADIISGTMQMYWGLNMDRVEVCKDCEYRYVCFDCRPYSLGLTDNLYAKSPRCTYDPYTGRWGEAADTLLFKTLTDHVKK
jgi:radical SAM protein with 4Fe4S-binding SPASM domain